MRTIHVYSVNGEPYASAAEVVPAVLGKQSAKIVCHNVTTDVQGALLAAIGRAEDSLLYSVMKNAQATLVALSLLILLAWPPIYHAIPMPEVTLAARLAAGITAVLSILAALIADQKTRRLRRRSCNINKMAVTRRDDGLLPHATAWRQLSRRATFSWLGLGLMLFSLALNCIVVADYGRPAVLSDGTVRYSVSLTMPWMTWENNTRYLEDNFFVPYHYDEPTDTFYVLRVAYRVENTDPASLPPHGWKTWLVDLSGKMVNYAVSEVPNTLPPGVTEENIQLACAELFEYNEYKSSFLDYLKTEWAERYALTALKLASVDYELLVVTRAEAVKDFERHND